MLMVFLINKIKYSVVVLHVFIVLGNKTDLEHRYFSYDEAKIQVEYVAHYIVCSTKSCIGCEVAI